MVADSQTTPMMAQFIEIKSANPDSLLFYRMGDFYELFFRDAEIASRTLGIVLTKRGKHHGEDIPMCGVPVERADDYLQRLIAAGLTAGDIMPPSQSVEIMATLDEVRRQIGLRYPGEK